MWDDEKRNIATTAAPALALSDKTFNRSTRDLFDVDPYFPRFLFSLFRVNVIRDRRKSDGQTYVFSPKSKTNCDSKYCASVAVNEMRAYLRVIRYLCNLSRNYRTASVEIVQQRHLYFRVSNSFPTAKTNLVRITRESKRKTNLLTDRIRFGSVLVLKPGKVQCVDINTVKSQNRG